MMPVLKFKVNGGSGVAYVDAASIEAVTPLQPDSPEGAQILLHSGAGLTVINDADEVARDWADALASVVEFEKLLDR